MVRVTVLMDDAASGQAGLTAEHGLSYLLEGPSWRLLFDCGASVRTWDNARKLGLDVAGLDAVALSHGHYDHAGGYRSLMEQGLGSSLLYTGPGFFVPKLRADGTDLSAGFDADFLAAHGVTHREVRTPTEILPNVFLISDFPRVEAMETIPNRYVQPCAQGFRPDNFDDELCLVLRGETSVSVFVGCAHPGILNMLRHVRDVLGLPIEAVFGGIHLSSADENRLQYTADALVGLGVHTLGLSHCSGSRIQQLLQARPEVQFCRMACGDSWVLEA